MASPAAVVPGVVLFASGSVVLLGSFWVRLELGRSSTSPHRGSDASSAFSLRLIAYSVVGGVIIVAIVLIVIGLRSGFH
ncbi:MAG: hypothetical protein ACREOS_03380 [Candidatus Dormibacteraceae bacterium]